MNCVILVATHKPYWMPPSRVYLPLHVGSAGKESIGFVRDDGGKNISSQNEWYCELTGLYWGWKNLDVDYLGLVHYRRHFAAQKAAFRCEGKRHAVLGDAELECLLANHALILPKRRRYFIETRMAHFAKAHGIETLEAAQQALDSLCMEYLPAYQATMRRSWGHIYNMFIMRRDLLDAYCAWLFPLLQEVGSILSLNGLMQSRILGFIAERLLDVWVEHNRLPYKEVDCVFMEQTNWPVKIWNFIQRKYQ